MQIPRPRISFSAGLCLSRAHPCVKQRGATRMISISLRGMTRHYAAKTSRIKHQTAQLQGIIRPLRPPVLSIEDSSVSTTSTLVGRDAFQSKASEQIPPGRRAPNELDDAQRVGLCTTYVVSGNGAASSPTPWKLQCPKTVSHLLRAISARTQ